MDLEGVSALLTPEGWSLLESLPEYDEPTSLALGEQLRKAGHPASLVSAALTQSRLRGAARAKFGPFADAMLFTPTGLEQATRLPVAARHAQRFTSAGISGSGGRVADLGCGIGADSMALAGLELEVLSVEKDELTAAVATVNLRHWPEVEVRQDDVTTTDLTGVTAAFVDPARRNTAGRRLLDPRAGSPPLSFVLELAQNLPAVGMKTAPGIGHHLIPAGPPPCEAQWISVDGDVVEAGLWFGLTAREGIRRSALVLGDRGTAEVNDLGLPPGDPDRPPTRPVATFVYEPDGAVIRSGLVGRVAELVEGHLIDPSIAFVSSDRYVETPLATCFAVEEVFGFQLKILRTWLRDRGVGRLTIKKRGTAVDPDQLRKQLRLQGDNEATIILTRVAGRQSVLVVRPVRRTTVSVG